MKIIINQEEIVDAIKALVRSQISIQDDQEISVDFKAGRGDNGMEATIDIQAKLKPVHAKPKVVTRRATVAEVTEVVPTVATHIAARVAEDQAQADEEEVTEVQASITATPEDRQPPEAEPTPEAEAAPAPVAKVNVMFGAKTAALAAVEPVESAPVAIAAKKPSIFGGFPKASAEA